jgi:peptidoglycan/LPS O-acetylase OafA/YrhL
MVFLLAQTGRLLADDARGWIRPLDGLLAGGNLAVTVLLGLAGHLLTARLLARRPSGPAAVLRCAGSELAVIVAVVALVCAAAVVVDGVDETDGTDWATTWRTVLRALTFRFNDWVRDAPSSVRPDLTSLWFFSVLVQVGLLVVVLVLVLGGRPLLLALVLAAGAVASVVHREIVLEEQGWFVVSLATSTRADAFLLGAAAAALGRRLAPPPTVGPSIFGGATLILVGALLAPSVIGSVEETFGVLVPVVALLTAISAYAARGEADPRMLVEELLRRPAPAVVGQHWLLVVAWAPFVAVTVGRHVEQRPTGLAVGVALVVTTVAVAASGAVLSTVASRLGRARPEPVAEGRRSAAPVGGDDRRAGGEPPADG